MRNGCVFCDYAGPSPILARYSGVNDDVIVIKPLNPVAPGHVLVIPKRHVAHAIENPTLAAVCMRSAIRFAQEEDIGDCNIITSCGPAATQTVMHLHVHLIPRERGDGLSLPWSVEGAA
jgi:histidine triad (HIT) family protein